MRKTKRNIARKPKATKLNRTAATKTEPFASAEGPGSPSTNAAPPLSQSSHGANGAAGFVPQSRQGNGLPSTACSAAPPETDTRNPAPDTSDSDPRAERNRQNAQHSTGPRTPEGKAAASQNALKHGLSIQRHAILEHEDPADYEQLLAELREIYAPQSRREDLSVEDIAQCRWALQRFDQGEARLMDFHFARQARPDLDPDDRVSYGDALGYCCLREPDEPAPQEFPSFLLLQRYRAHWDRRHHRALAEFDRTQRARRAETADQRKQEEDQRKQADERRRQELHELKVALAQTQLAEAQAKAAAKQAKSEEAAFFQALEKHLHAPHPGLTEDELAGIGFVPQPGDKPQATSHGANNSAGFVPQFLAGPFADNRQQPANGRSLAALIR